MLTIFEIIIFIWFLGCIFVMCCNPIWELDNSVRITVFWPIYLFGWLISNLVKAILESFEMIFEE